LEKENVNHTSFLLIAGNVKPTHLSPVSANSEVYEMLCHFAEFKLYRPFIFHGWALSNVLFIGYFDFLSFLFLSCY
jgi:hypothetical protein